MFGHLLYGCAWQQATVLVTAYIQNTYKETQGSNTRGGRTKSCAASHCKYCYQVIAAIDVTPR